VGHVIPVELPAIGRILHLGEQVLVVIDPLLEGARSAAAGRLAIAAVAAEE